MKNTDKNPILITGSHRSGSTWTGRMIALAPSIAYIHEPFNIQHRPGICKAKFNYHFPYICNENEHDYFMDLKDCYSFKYHFLEELKISKSFKDVARAILYYTRFNKYRILNKRALIKDPIAIFSAEWLAQKFNMNVVVLIRHPAAFAGSLKKVKWSHPFEDFLQQPLLMKHYLSEYKEEIEEFSKNDKNIVDQAILLWNLIHSVISRYQSNHTNWIFLKHEDLSSRPIEEFKKLYNKLNLAFPTNIEEEIKAFCYSEYPYGSKSFIKSKIKGLKRRLADDHSDKRKRNSQSNIWSWRQRLTADEIKEIRRKTFEIARKFYTDESWIR
jgi:hypothetical protein